MYVRHCFGGGVGSDKSGSIIIQCYVIVLSAHSETGTMQNQPHIYFFIRTKLLRQLAGFFNINI